MNKRLERLVYVASAAKIPLNLMTDLVNAAHATQEYHPKMIAGYFVESTLNALVNGTSVIQILMMLDTWRNK